jgi:argininosuccinate lyase
VAGLVRRLEAEGRDLADPTPEEWAQLEPRLGAEATRKLPAARSVARRTTPGGPSLSSVRWQLERLRAGLR